MAGGAGGETEREPSALTPDMLYRIMEQRFADRDALNAERDRRYTERFIAQQAALDEKKETTDARLDLLNESKQTIADVVGRTMPRLEIEAENRRGIENDLRQDKEIQALSARLDQLPLVALTKGWGIMTVGVAMVVGIITIVVLLR